jgi:hypothetical protein
MLTLADVSQSSPGLITVANAGVSLMTTLSGLMLLPAQGGTVKGTEDWSPAVALK